MSIIVTTEPIEVKFDQETTIYLQRDPSGTQGWFTLIRMKVSLNDEKVRPKLIEALAELAQSEGDAKLLRDLPETVGIATLKWVAEQYIEEVTSFPTKPSGSSTKS